VLVWTVAQTLEIAFCSVGVGYYGMGSLEGPGIWMVVLLVLLERRIWEGAVDGGGTAIVGMGLSPLMMLLEVPLYGHGLLISDASLEV
jgi:hypothetical protein